MINKSNLNFELFGLLHLEENEKTSMNIATRNFEEQVLIYIENAVTLSNSLKSKGIEFTLLTNKKRIVDSFLQNKEYTLKVEKIPFITKVPTGLSFYSAHFKIDAFRFLAKQKKKYVGLCDLDMVCINNIPPSLKKNIKSKTPLFYDISDQVIPAYGHKIIIRDLESISGEKSEGRWIGGEFITGTPAFFSILIKEIDKIFGNYIKNIKNLHHVGDEAITSAALELIEKSGKHIADAGKLGIVGRYWNSDVLHTQKPLDYFANHFLLHLPGDKNLLSKMASQTFNNKSFFKLYSAHVNSFPSRTRRKIQRLKRKLKS